VAGRGDIAGTLGQLTADQLIDGKRISVTQLGARDAGQARDCQILFVGRGGTQARERIAATARAPVLLVTDSANGSRGGAVEFVVRDGRVRFTVNRGEAETRRLVLSSKLLEVAAEITR
jgi:hypothetical protein